ncbi:MAG TPA: histone deacetylase family protein [Stellaceae bacterium]|nr:histone deacetylase family protein [Stellaceae bacterium]
MRTFYTDEHRLHHSSGELVFGRLVPAFEKPERAEVIRARLQERAVGEVGPPSAFPSETILRVHDAGMVRFLETGYGEWQAAGRTGDALAYAFRARHMRDDRVPEFIDGKLSYYAFDVGVALTPTTWQAIRRGVDVALSAAEEVRSGQNSAFALCRPPGHHVQRDQFGGYCYLNNAAIAAQYFLDRGAGRVAILDVDYHHGNGTQEIFWNRSDVLLASLHGDPNYEYPYLSGHADEAGAGPGEGFNVNFPMPAGTAWDTYGAAHEAACRRIEDYAPDVVVVSLGVDTYKKDPISAFKLDHEDYLRMGERIARLGRPTLFVMEGGYAVAEIGINTVNVLEGFLS